MSYRDVLSIRSFRHLWLGQMIALLGDSFYFVIFMFMVKQITGDNAMVGYVGALGTLPYLLFSIYAGTLADRLDRRLIMLISDILSGVSLLIFALVIYFDATPPVWTIFTISFFLSAFRVFITPARTASVASLVPQNMLYIATSLNVATQNVMPMISLSLSATVLAALFEISPQLFFLAAVLLNALSFLVSACCVYLLPRLRPDRVVNRGKSLQDIKDGLRYIWGRRELSVLMILQMCLTMLISPFFVVYVAANEQWFGGGPATLAWFEFAFFAGMVICSFSIGKLRLTRPGLGFSYGLSVVGFAVVAMAFTPYFWPFLLLQFVCGTAVPFAEIPVATYLQASTPDGLRGRVNSVYNMLQQGMAPIGYSMGGILVDGVGLVGAFIIMGVGMAASALAGLLDRSFRESRMPEGVVSGDSIDVPLPSEKGPETDTVSPSG